MALNKKQNFIKTTPQEFESLLEQSPALAEAAKYGVDIPLLLDNLKRTVSQRIRRNQAALNAIEQLQKARPL